MKSITKLAEHKLLITTTALASLVVATGCNCGHSTQTSYYKAPTATGTYASTAPAPAPAPAPTTTMAEGTTNMVVPLYQENLAVGKREVDAGSVRLRKIVKTETVNQPVELRREEIVIERLPAGSQPAPSQANLGQPFEQQETVIPLKREEAVVEKQTSTSGQIVVKSSYSSQQTNIQAQVRREDIDIVKVGNPQNVIIGQGVKSSEATGAAESPGGQSTESSGSVTSAAMLTSADPSSLVGRQVQLSGVKVHSVLGNRVLGLTSEGGQPFYAVSKQPTENVNVGDMVTISGNIKQIDASAIDASNLSEQAAQKVKAQRFYIETDKIEVSGK